jgi:hypothetical protein
MRSSPRLHGRLLVLTAIAGLLAVLIATVSRMVQFGEQVLRWLGPGPESLSVFPVLPLAAGLIALIILMIPPRSSHRAGFADVTRRTVLTFVRARWIITVVVLAAVVIVTSIAAGVGSVRDDDGHYTMLWVDAGVGRVGTTMYGWFYSVPALIALALLLVATWIGWMLVARPPWSDDPAGDLSVRRTRSDNIGRAASGAVTLHLGYIFQSLSGTGSLWGAVSASRGVTVFVGSPIAGIASVLHWASLVAVAVGLALWLTIALTAVPARRVAQR